MFELYINGKFVLSYKSYYEAYVAYTMATRNIDTLPPYYPEGNETEVKLLTPDAKHQGYSLMYRRTKV